MNRETIAAAGQALLEPMHSCGHVFTGDAEAIMVCMLHPTSGALCSMCQTAHAERHDGASVCASCAVPLSPNCIARGFSVDVASLTLTNPKTGGESIRLGARVHLVGVVQCADCYALSEDLL